MFEGLYFTMQPHYLQTFHSHPKHTPTRNSTTASTNQLLTQMQTEVRSRPGSRCPESKGTHTQKEILC